MCNLYKRSGIFWIVCVGCLAGLLGCSTATEQDPSDLGVRDTLHLGVPPAGAIALLEEVAKDNGWVLLGAGDQLDVHGDPRGKYFRLQVDKTIGGKKLISGVFFAEPAGSYTVLNRAGNEEMGFPLALVEPMVAAMEPHDAPADVPPE